MRASATRAAALIPVLASLGTSVPAVLSGQIAHALHVNVASTALVLTVFTVGLGVTTPVAGLLIDRFGDILPIRIGGLVLVIVSALVFVVPDLPLLLIVRFMQGSAIGVITNAAFTRVSVVGSPPNRARKLGVLTAGACVMTGVGPLLGSAVGATFGWRLPLTAPVLAGIVAIWVSKLSVSVYSTPPVASQHRHRGLRSADIHAIFRLLRQARVRYLLLAGGALNATALAVAFLVPEHLARLGSSTLSASVGAWLLPAAFVAALASVVIGRLQAPVGHVLGLTAIAATTGALLAGLVPYRPVLVVAAATATAGFASAQVLLLSWLPVYAPPSEMATALATASLSLLLGGILGPALAGVLLAATGNSIALLLVALFPLPALAAWPVLVPHRSESHFQGTLKSVLVGFTRRGELRRQPAAGPAPDVVHAPALDASATAAGFAKDPCPSGNKPLDAEI